MVSFKHELTLLEILAEFFHKMNNCTALSFEIRILKIPGLGQVNSKRKTPEGKRRRSELEKILAKNAYYKKLSYDREVASKQFPIPGAKSDEHLKPSQIPNSENTDVELNDSGKFKCDLLLTF